MSEVTPGPWRVSSASMDGFHPVMAQGGVIVALVSALAGKAPDANLISAAPELLEALELADATLRGVNMDRDYVARKVGAALDKAKGAA